MATVDPYAISQVLHAVLDAFRDQYDLARRAAGGLIAIVATLEVATFGILYALSRDEFIVPLVRMTFRLGAIVFLVNGYDVIVATLLDGFIRLAGGDEGAADAPGIQSLLEDPSGIFLLGYDAGLSLIEVSVRADAQQPGIAILFGVMGIGAILLLGLIAVRIVQALAVFYGLSAAAVVLVPLGAFSRWDNVPDRLMSATLAAAVRVMIVAGVAGSMAALWSRLGVEAFDERTPLDASIGLLLVLLVFFFLIGTVPEAIVRALSGLLANAQATPVAGLSRSVAMDASQPAVPAPVAPAVPSMPRAVAAAAMLPIGRTPGEPAPAIAAVHGGAEAIPNRLAGASMESPGAMGRVSASMTEGGWKGLGFSVDTRPVHRTEPPPPAILDRRVAPPDSRTDRWREEDKGKAERLRQMRLAFQGGRNEDQPS